MIVNVVVVVVLDGDGDGDVEVDATFDETAATCGRCARHAQLPTSRRLPTSHRAAYDIVDVLPRGHADRADQLTRAAAGRWPEADSANRYKIARGEAMECAAWLDLLKLRKLLSEERYERGVRLLEGVVAMLTKML